jgi:hypothetical protein
MNAYPVRLAAGLALIAVCAPAEESTNAKMAEPQTKPAVVRKTTPKEVLNNKPVQLPTEVVDGWRDHIDHVNRELHLVFQRQETAPHALYQIARTKNTVVAAFSPLEEGSNHSVALPMVRSSW